jgi:hypothetical protein
MDFHLPTSAKASTQPSSADADGHFSDDRIHLLDRDKKPGMSKAHLNRLFQRLRKGEFGNFSEKHIKAIESQFIDAADADGALSPVQYNQVLSTLASPGFHTSLAQLGSYDQRHINALLQYMTTEGLEH